MGRFSRDASSWIETALVTLLCSLLIALMTKPAFDTFFLAEDFVYLAQYRNHGDNYLQAIFSPMAGIFFRPVLSGVNIFWLSVLPFDPFIHHVRNLVLTVTVVMLLYRLLVQLVESWRARLVAILLFSASKIHLTTIGYITNYDSSITLILLLATMLCFLRYIEQRRRFDYYLGLVFCSLSMFTRDYGAVVVPVVFALVIVRGIKYSDWRGESFRWARLLAPLPLMILGYVAIRYTVVGAPPSTNQFYSPQLSLDVIMMKLLLLTMTLSNVVISDVLVKSTTGANGLGSGLALLIPGLPPEWGDTILYALYIVLLIVTIVAAGRRVWWSLLFPLAMIAAYFGPTLLLTRNIQMYYMYEAIAATSVLIAMCLDRARYWILRTWYVAVIVIAANGAVSNYTSTYSWQFAAKLVEQIEEPVLNAYAGRPLDSITFVTGNHSFWQWALTADTNGPMIPALMGLPDLDVRVVDYRNPPIMDFESNERNPILDIDNGFIAFSPTDERLPLMLGAISNEHVKVGTGFNVQPNGNSAIGAVVGNARPGTVIIVGETRLMTTFVSSTALAAEVPLELLMKPGRYDVYLSDGVRESNRLEFIVVVDGQE